MKLDPKIGRSLKKASPTILTCIGAAGVVATAALAVKATPKADSLIKADSRRNHDGDPYAATKLEAVKSCWKCYIPAAATGVATIICIFGANTLNTGAQESNLGQAADECSGDDRFAGADARRFLCILFHQGDRCCVVYGVCRGGPRVHGGLCGNVRI